MIFDPPLQSGQLIQRIKRFTALVDTEEGPVRAHCANTGSMKTCFNPGCTVYLSQSSNPKRKLPTTWEISEPHTGDYVGINTHLTNSLVHEAINHKLICSLREYKSLRREAIVTDPHSSIQQRRLDFHLYDHPQHADLYCEVKNATLYDPSHKAVMFPDAPTQRGKAHLKTLMHIKQSGLKAALLFVANRPVAQIFKPAFHIDLEYATLLKQAHELGVEILVYQTHILPPHSITITRQLPFDLSLSS